VRLYIAPRSWDNLAVGTIERSGPPVRHKSKIAIQIANKKRGSRNVTDRFAVLSDPSHWEIRRSKAHSDQNRRSHVCFYDPFVCLFASRSRSLIILAASAIGSAFGCPMSVLPSIADIDRASRNVRLVPIADSCVFRRSSSRWTCYPETTPCEFLFAMEIEARAATKRNPKPSTRHRSKLGSLLPHLGF